VFEFGSDKNTNDSWKEEKTCVYQCLHKYISNETKKPLKISSSLESFKMPDHFHTHPFPVQHQRERERE